MARFNPHKISRKKQEMILDEFCRAVLLINNIDDSRKFFRDLLNRTERTMLARRLEIALMLELGFTYDQIKKILRVGGDTVSRVSRWLYFGRNGYREILKRMDNTEKENLIKIYLSYYR